VQKILYSIGGVLGVLLLIGLLLPRHGSFVLSATIDAHPATVFSLLNDMRRTRLWSRASEIDPNARVEYSGPVRGAGTTMSWQGAIAGGGTQTVTESRPYEFLATIINAGEDGESRTWFELTPLNGTTQLAWTFSHDHGYDLVGRYMSPLLTGVIRRDYEQSLTNLTELAESLPRADFSDLRVERLEVEPMQIAFKSMRSSPDAAKLSEALGRAYFDILNFMEANKLRLAGAPLSIARSFEGAELRFDAGIPVTGVNAETPKASTGVQLGRTYGGDVLRIKHTGSYRNLKETHRKIAAYLAALGIERNGDSWEAYVGDPAKVEESKLLTYLYYPVRDKP
jgi:effector-binding domain-containing protein/uncharacterized protein YndB with AHSA1/START domain